MSSVGGGAHILGVDEVALPGGGGMVNVGAFAVDVGVGAVGDVGVGFAGGVVGISLLSVMPMSKLLLLMGSLSSFGRICP